MQITISYNIYDIRQKQGLTLRQLSIQSGVGLATLTDLENGKSDPRLSTICLVATALDVPVTQLFSYTCH